MRLKKPCEHGRYDEHTIWVSLGQALEGHKPIDCPGGEFLTDNALTGKGAG